nr:ROK family protein [uncultured Methanobrevibacter sp.]
MNSHELFEKYRQGDETAKEVIRDYAETIAAGIVTIQSVLDAKKFCIGGGISAQDILIAEIKDKVYDFYSIKFHEAVSETAIEKCHFGNASGCVGALYNFS